MHTETGLSLNKITKPAPGVILIRSRCRNYFAFYDIKKFFRSVRISEKYSYLRIVCVPYPSFSVAPCSKPTWRFYRDQAIPFGDSASGDYAACAKAATILAFIDESPIHLPEAIKQAVLEDIYVQSLNHVNILTSSAKIMGKSAMSAPLSEISSAVLAVRMELKVKQKL